MLAKCSEFSMVYTGDIYNTGSTKAPTHVAGFQAVKAHTRQTYILFM